MISPDDFKAMPMDLKLETLNERGYWLSTINDYQFQIKVYRVHEFYIQTWFDLKTQEIIDLVCLLENPLEDILGHVRLNISV